MDDFEFCRNVKFDFSSSTCFSPTQLLPVCLDYAVNS